jgi:hypothetical protein
MLDDWLVAPLLRHWLTCAREGCYPRQHFSTRQCRMSVGVSFPVNFVNAFGFACLTIVHVDLARLVGLGASARARTKPAISALDCRGRSRAASPPHVVLVGPHAPCPSQNRRRSPGGVWRSRRDQDARVSRTISPTTADGARRSEPCRRHQRRRPGASISHKRRANRNR